MSRRQIALLYSLFMLSITVIMDVLLFMADIQWDETKLFLVGALSLMGYTGFILVYPGFDKK